MLDKSESGIVPKRKSMLSYSVEEHLRQATRRTEPSD